MFEKLKQLLKNAVRFFQGATTESVESEEMDVNLSKWERIYQDNAPWLDKNTTSLNLGKTICQILSTQVLAEASIRVEGENDKAKLINTTLQKHLIPKLKEQLEKGMAMGGMMFKPYVSNKQVYIDFYRQGQFRALGFDDDKNLTDVAFMEQYTDGNKVYTRVERQTLQGDSIHIVNKAFVSKSASSLGDPISLELVDRWSSIEPDITVNDTTSTQYGFYRVPIANNIDFDSPLGVSVFSPSIRTMQKADEQFSRLDWEYEGGAMAIDVAEDAVSPTNTSYRRETKLDRTRERLYRKLDLDSDTTYEVFAPSLRDANYMSGLNFYLRIIEDQVGLSRGTLCDPSSDARTATEILALKQRTYETIKGHHIALETALRQLVDAISYLIDFYELAPEGDYNLVIEWNDSVLEDHQSELDRQLQLMDAGIKSKVEVRMWETGEDEETAIEKVSAIDSPLDLYAGLEGDE